MPYQTSFSQLPCGERYIRMEPIGRFSEEDAAALIRQINPGGRFHGIPALILTAKMESISAEARGLFARENVKDKGYPWVAAVVTNPVVRVALNFIMRIQGSYYGMMFANEAAAIEWLDAQVLRDRSGAAGKR
jgi:hypothetical protein